MGALPQLMIMLYAAATDLTFSEICHDSVFLFRLAACVITYKADVQSS